MKAELVRRIFGLAVTSLIFYVIALPVGAETVRVALIENEPAALTLQFVQPIERVLREAGPGAALKSVDELPCAFTDDHFHLRLSSGHGAPDIPSSAEGAALEAGPEILFVYPPVPSLLAALKKAAADPATFRLPDSMRFTELKAKVVSDARSGMTFSVVDASVPRRPGVRSQTALAIYYRLLWQGQNSVIVLIGRANGGLGRLETAAALEAGKAPFTGLARGGTFGTEISDLRGRASAEALEKAGLRFSAVSASEIQNWAELEAYRRDRPFGIQYLSANLVYSSAPLHTLLPPYAVFTSSGTRVAVVGLTPDWAGRLLKTSGLAGAEIEDPVSAVESLVPRLRAEADIVAVLSQLGAAGNARLAETVRGIDLIFSDDAPFLLYSPPPASIFEERDRPVFANPIPPLNAYAPALNMTEVERRAEGGLIRWKVRQSAALLDDEVIPAEGFPEPALKSFAVAESTDPAVLPSAREVFPPSERAGLPVYESRDFWTLSAAMLAERAHAEAGLLLVSPLQTPTVGAVRESYVRHWLGAPDAAVLVRVRGSRLRSLAEDAAEQKRREDAGLSLAGRIRLTVSGFDAEKDLVRGSPFDPDGIYLIATSLGAADALGLPEPYLPVRGASTVADGVIGGLRSVPPSASASDWRSWIAGKPVSERGVWKVYFRDISLNTSQTRVRRSDAFNDVPNTRIQGFNELVVGETFKTDVEYLRSTYKWGTTLEMEYARDRLSPRGQPMIVNLSANRVMLLTLGTLRTGGIPYSWFARSWGPSLGFEADGELRKEPTEAGLPRRQIYSVFPGVEFYNGSVVQTLELTGNIKRDLSSKRPTTQSGMRLRGVVSTEVGPAGAKVDGEVWSNYFFRSHVDNPTDLGFEGDANIKLSIPLYKHFSIAPFIDYYWFALKTRQRWGYSLMMGVSFRFSRLWKPQYESF